MSKKYIYGQTTREKTKQRGIIKVLPNWVGNFSFFPYLTKVLFPVKFMGVYQSPKYKRTIEYNFSQQGYENGLNFYFMGQKNS